jgi:nucleotide-binding universal stress UspA family protein
MTHPLHRIVVGSSLAPQSDGVVASALGFSRLVGAKLEVVHAYVPPMPYIGDPFPVAWASDELLADHEAALERALAAQAERVGAQPGEMAGFRLTPSPPALALEEAARKFDAGLIVVGPAESGSRIARRLLGSTSDRLLRHSARPILLTRRLEPPARFCCRSTSRFLDARPGLGARTMRTFGQHMPSSKRCSSCRPFRNRPTCSSPAQVERLTMTNRRAPRQVEEQSIGRRIRIGRPSEEILAEIHEREVELVILGTHGRTGLERFMLGSVASDITRDARCSVIIVPPAAG